VPVGEHRRKGMQVIGETIGVTLGEDVGEDQGEDIEETPKWQVRTKKLVLYEKVSLLEW